MGVSQAGRHSMRDRQAGRHESASNIWSGMIHGLIMTLQVVTGDDGQGGEKEEEEKVADVTNGGERREEKETKESISLRKTEQQLKQGNKI
ncbi:hypothetical protein Pcinc_020924 [Petrolisthes cinctipes]|uniref:Uncharacterized protein n=1 Tax=Petrolisthes cinctipes TaxID=88211 RepID=A0AAE1KJ68_PETCI|nr:hypothetical protein Pcinc_020924 [Petrolisthes cinctipes]